MNTYQVLGLILLYNIVEVLVRNIIERRNKCDHTCHCGTASIVPHQTTQHGCVRLLVDSPAPLANDMWLVDGHSITGFTLREQRGYHQHPCGCWSRSPDSCNSIEE